MNGVDIPDPPLALLAELTHRCALGCPYCSNPLRLDRASAELDTMTWCRVMREAASLGVLQVHLSGGEPLVRRDLTDVVAAASAAGLYANLITSGLDLTPDRMAALRNAGLEHVQLSLQDVDAERGDRIAHLRGAQRKKRQAAETVHRSGAALTLNIVVHRRNLDRLQPMIEFAVALGAERLEIAHAQYYGWALANRAALLPTRSQVDRASAIVEVARSRHAGTLAIDYVASDYFANRPKSCMGGWGRRFMNITPSGRMLPCHAAETLPGFRFPIVAETSLADAWYHSPPFARFRGTSWMPEPCRYCERRTVDWGGCRCQAFAFTGDAARPDPVCALSADHTLIAAAREDAHAPSDRSFAFRRYARGAATALDEH